MDDACARLSKDRDFIASYAVHVDEMHVVAEHAEGIEVDRCWYALGTPKKLCRISIRKGLMHVHRHSKRFCKRFGLHDQIVRSLAHPRQPHTCPYLGVSTMWEATQNPLKSLETLVYVPYRDRLVRR